MKEGKKSFGLRIVLPIIIVNTNDEIEKKKIITIGI
jgi:hypothetical protein